MGLNKKDRLVIHTIIFESEFIFVFPAERNKNDEKYFRFFC